MSLICNCPQCQVDHEMNDWYETVARDFALYFERICEAEDASERDRDG